MTDETTDEAIVHATTDEAMLAVMREIEVIAKTRRSEAGGNYMFRGIEELLEAIAPACRRHGLLTPTSVGAPIISTYQAGSGGRTTMNHVILPVTVHFRTPGGDVVESGGLGEAADSGDKAVSKAYSVGYREIMFKTFVIPTRGDDYDTERDDATRAPKMTEAEQAAAAAEQAESVAISLGWKSAAEHEAMWAQFKADCAGRTPFAEWVRALATGRGVKKSTLSADLIAEIEEVHSHVTDDGSWAEGYEPSASSQ